MWIESGDGVEKAGKRDGCGSKIVRDQEFHIVDSCVSVRASRHTDGRAD